MSRRIEVRRNPDGSVDEVLLYDGAECLFHLEQMGPANWYFGLYPNGLEDLKQFGIWLEKRTIHVRPYNDPPEWR
jgi:hypothetical protein